MIEKLKAELNGANAATYTPLTDAQVAVLLNVADIPRTRAAISGSELFGYTDETEYTALTEGKKQQWLSLCGIDTVTAAAVPLIKSLFNAGSVTWGNVVKTETISRAQEIGIPEVHEGHVTRARA